MATRRGNQNPTRSLILPYKKSKYKEAVDIYEKSGRTSQEWQTNLLKHILAYNEEGLWVHSKFGYSLPRRNGKNEVVAMRELYGLLNGESILHTAHRSSTSHSAWERLVKLLEASGFQEKTDFKKFAQFGLERIEMMGDYKGKISFRTRTAVGGLGEGFDLLVIDEAQEYTTEQESTLKYVVSDSPNGQTLYCGTPPTPISSGTVFTNLRNNALQGDTLNTGWAEWSVEFQSNIRDRELWYLTNPSLGAHLKERAIVDELGDDEIDFNIQRLGLWIQYNQKSAISAIEWQELKISKVPKLKGGLYVGIKYGPDGQNVALSIAVKTLSGSVFIESIDCQSVRNGNNWIIGFLKSADIEQVAIDGASGQSILTSEMRDFGLNAPILPTVKEIIRANALFEQAVFSGELMHRDQPSLTQVITNSEKRNIGTNGGFGYRSQIEDADIALMDSVILAHWLCVEHKDTAKQQIWY